MLLEAAGITAGEAFPAGERAAIRDAVAAVCIHSIDQETGIVTFEIRILSPRVLGLSHGQDAAVRVMDFLCKFGFACRMEQMVYEAGCDCYSMTLLADLPGLVSEWGLQVYIGMEPAEYVTEFSVEQDRQRRLVRSLNESEPLAISPGVGGCKFRLVRMAPAGVVYREPEEPFTMIVVDYNSRTAYSGCGLSRVEMERTAVGTKIVWEGFALKEEVVFDE